jgi:hypothetical protein
MSKEIVTTITDEQKALLAGSFPAEKGYTRTQLPRLGMFSQDATEGKGKAMKVVTEAGTFYTEKETTDEDGNRVWKKEEIGTSIKGIIIYQRKQLKHYDEATGIFTSSSVFDDENEVVPLWANKAEIDRGTPEELKARPQYKFEKDGKVKSKLEDNRILYILYEGDLYQMNLRGSSMYSWLTYSRKVIPPTVLTTFGSESKEKGTIAWNQMTFEKDRDLTTEEGDNVVGHVAQIRDAINQEKAFFATKTVEEDEDLKAFD